MPTLSIIMPVYNVLPFLKRAVDSVLTQTFNDFELILVDDGSTDGSGELCNELAGTDSRIRVIHQSNKGLSGARTTGYENARSDYLSFIDSDDVVLQNRFELLMSALQESKADIARDGAIIIPDDTLPMPLPTDEAGYRDIWRDVWRTRGYEQDRVYDTASFTEYFLENNDFHNFWSFVIRKDAIKPKYLAEGLRRSEDLFFWIHLFDDKPELVIRTLTSTTYVYITRGSGSLITDYGLWGDSRQVKEILKLHKLRLALCSEHGFDRGYTKSLSELAKYGIYGFINLSKSSSLNPTVRKEYLRLLRRNTGVFLKDPENTFTLILCFLILIVSPGLYIKRIKPRLPMYAKRS